MLYFISFLITCLNALFCQEQFGFRTGHSTELASLQLTDYLIKQMDQGSTPLNIYILISQRPLTPLIILYYSPNGVIMESQAVRINFLSAICPTDINMLNTKIMHNLWQNYKLLVYHKAQFWALYYFSYILMTCPK